MIIKNLDTLVYAPQTPLRKVLRELYKNGAPICLVCTPGRKLLGIVTIGDLKHALLQGNEPQTPIRSIMNAQFKSLPEHTPERELKRLAKAMTPAGPIVKVPLIDADGRVTGLYLSHPRHTSSGQTILITGGAGYLGSVLSRLLLTRGYRVIALDKLLFGDEGVRELKRNPRFKLVQGDIADIGTLIQWVPEADAVIHLAGIVGDPASSLNPMQTMEENHFATKALIDMCSHYQVSRFVFASSCSVYGASPAMLDEESKLNPVSLYAQSKLYAEREILKAANGEFHPVVLRFGTLYGLSPRMRFDLVVNTMTAHAHFNKKIMVDGGKQWRPLLHVEDAARACIAAIEAPPSAVGHIFNVGNSKENYRIEDIARTVQRSVPKATLDIRDTVRDRRDYRVSFGKIHKLLGFQSRRTLKSGVREMESEMKKGRFKDWAKKKYSNYLTLKSTLEILP